MRPDTSDGAERRGNAPWEGYPHLTETALAEQYPDVLGPGKWDHTIAGGPPPGPREFWIAEQFGCSRRGLIKRFAMAMYARKGLGAIPEHYVNVRKNAGHGVSGKKLVQENVFRQFHVKTREDSKVMPYGFRTAITEHGYYRVIWLGDEAITVKEAAEFALHELQRESLPLRVLSWRVETGFDTTDDPAVWVWTTLEPGAVCARDAKEKRNALEERVIDTVWERVREYDDNIWIYVYLIGSESSTAR